MDLNKIIGHEKIIESIKKTIKENKVSHSYLFEGEESIGKKKLAFFFAKTLLCKEKGNIPCNRCSSCIKFDNLSHPDFFLIEPDNNIIRVSQIEALIKEVNTTPFESTCKVFIIDDSHKMNIESKNTLLKTLEEPPYYVHIILISSSKNNLLATIISRVQNIKFYPVEHKKVKDLLINEYNKSEEEASFLAEFTKGAIGQAIKLSNDQAFFQRRDEIIKIIGSLLNKDKTKAFSSIEFFNDNKEIIDEILDIFLLWFRDLLLYINLGENSLLVNKDKIENLSLQSNVEFNKINDIIVRIQETKVNIRRNVNYQLAIETMLLNIGGN